MGEGFAHEPVMLAEVLRYLEPGPGDVILDATVGGGGHSHAILERIGVEGSLIGIDRDAVAVEAARAHLAPLSDHVHLVHGDFTDAASILARRAPGPLAGALFDLGVSSPQFDDPERGFSYQSDAPLDMRMDARQAVSAFHLVNGLSEDELSSIIHRFGEERWAHRIAAFIVARRASHGMIHTTGELVEVITAAVPAGARRTGGHPARRTFQALRIAVNNELGALEAGLRGVVPHLRPGGHLVVISFHSLEDRIVKHVLRELGRDCVCPPEWPVCRCGGGHAQLRNLTPHPVVPTSEEVARNPRARSAKLRAAERLPQREGPSSRGEGGRERDGARYPPDAEVQASGVPSIAETLSGWERPVPASGGAHRRHRRADRVVMPVEGRE